MIDTKEPWAIPPELILDHSSEEPIFNLDVDRPLRSGDLPVPDRIESLSESELSPDLPRLDSLPIADPLQSEDQTLPEPWPDLRPDLRIDSRRSRDAADWPVGAPEIRFGDQSEMAEIAEMARIAKRADVGEVNGLALTLKNYPNQALVPAAGQHQEKHIIFALAGTKYTVLMSQVIEVGELNTFTRIPNVPDWVLGITNLHGDIVSIVDIRALLGLERDDRVENYNLLVTQTFEGDITASLVVEQVLGIASISAAQIQVVETAAEDGLTAYVRGVYNHGGELLTVINLEGLLRSLDVVH